MTATMGVTTPDIVRERINNLHCTANLSYRKIALMEEFRPIPPGTLCAIAKGQDVPKRWRKQLGLAATGVVYVVGEGEIPPGAQVISANIAVCECGMPFFSNHPARKRCFICSPYKRRAKQAG